MNPGFLERKRLERTVSSISGLTTATQSRACYCPHHCTGGWGWEWGEAGRWSPSYCDPQHTRSGAAADPALRR